MEMLLYNFINLLLSICSTLLIFNNVTDTVLFNSFIIDRDWCIQSEVQQIPDIDENITSEDDQETSWVWAGPSSTQTGTRNLE